MKKEAPDDLNARTPQWFKDWRNKEFWHFKLKVETKVAGHEKLLWIILAAAITALVFNILN